MDCSRPRHLTSTFLAALVGVAFGMACFFSASAHAKVHVTGHMKVQAHLRQSAPSTIRVDAAIKSRSTARRGGDRRRVVIEQYLRGRWRGLERRRPNVHGHFSSTVTWRGPASTQVVILRAHARSVGRVSRQVRVPVSETQPVDVTQPVDIPVGFNDNAVTDRVATPEGAATLLSSVGADVDRVQIGWDAIEPTPGEYRFATFDAIYAADLADGIKPLFIFAFAPAWASGSVCAGGASGCHAPPTPDHYDAAALAVAKIAERYPEAAGIEIWNEPNTPYFWRPAPNPAAYTALLTVCYQAVKAVDPTMPVAGGATAAGFAGSPGKIPATQFLSAMYANGAAASMDAISMHTYPDPAVDSAVAAVNAMREVRDRIGDPSTPIWITEAGASTTGIGAVSEAEQASLVVDLNRELSSTKGVEMLLFHTLVEPNRGGSSIETGFGMVTGDGRKKPAYCALGTAWGHPQAC